jgi:hypothetical protein
MNYQTIIDSYGVENLQKLRASKLLVVGAGGIGCEVFISIFFYLSNTHYSKNNNTFVNFYSDIKKSCF